MKHAFIRTTFLFILVTSLAFSQHIYVLCYHTFMNHKRTSINFTTETLQEQIDLLREEGFTFVTYFDLVNGTVVGYRNVLVTIDDGHNSVYDAYYAVFQPEGIQPVLGIIANYVGHVRSCLSWDEIAELYNAGCTIASHSYSHPRVDYSLYQSSKTKFNREIYTSKSMIEDALGIYVDSFIYPYGSRSKVSRTTVANAGYSYAFTCDDGPVILPIHENHDPQDLPRYALTRRGWRNELALVIRSAEEAEEAHYSRFYR